MYPALVQNDKNTGKARHGSLDKERAKNREFENIVVPNIFALFCIEIIEQDPYPGNNPSKDHVPVVRQDVV